MRFLSCFCLCSLLFLSFISALFGRARKRPKGQIRHPLRAKTCFSRCTLALALPQGRQPMVKKDFNNRMDKRQKTTKNMKCQGPGAGLKKKAPKMTSRRLPETLREPPGRARIGPRGAKRAPRRPQEPPRPGRPPGAPLAGHFGAQRRPGGLQALIWCPPGPLGKHLLT